MRKILSRGSRALCLFSSFALSSFLFGPIHAEAQRSVETRAPRNRTLERAGRALHSSRNAAANLDSHFSDRARDAAGRLREGRTGLTSVEELHAAVREMESRAEQHAFAVTEHRERAALLRDRGDADGAELHEQAALAHIRAGLAGFESEAEDHGRGQLLSSSRDAFRASQKALGHERSRSALTADEALGLDEQAEALSAGRSAMVRAERTWRHLRSHFAPGARDGSGRRRSGATGLTSVEELQSARRSLATRVEHHREAAELHNQRAVALRSEGDVQGATAHQAAMDAHLLASEQTIDTAQENHGLDAILVSSALAHQASMRALSGDRSRARTTSANARPSTPQLSSADLQTLNELIGASELHPERIRVRTASSHISAEIREAAELAASLIEQAKLDPNASRRDRLTRLREFFGSEYPVGQERMNPHALWAIRNALAGQL